jgi:hypothetical protein
MTTLTEKVVSALTGRMTDEEWRRWAYDEYPEDGHHKIVRETERARAREKRLESALREILAWEGMGLPEDTAEIARKALEE